MQNLQKRRELHVDQQIAALPESIKSSSYTTIVFCAAVLVMLVVLAWLSISDNQLSANGVVIAGGDSEAQAVSPFSLGSQRVSASTMQQRSLTSSSEEGEELGVRVTNNVAVDLSKSEQIQQQYIDVTNIQKVFLALLGPNPSGVTIGELDGMIQELLKNTELTSSNILDGTISLLDLAVNTIASQNILDGAILPEDLSTTALALLDRVEDPGFLATQLTESLTTLHITDGTLTNADLSSLAGIDITKLAKGESGQLLLTDELGLPSYITPAGALTLDQGNIFSLAPGAVTSLALLDGAITGDDILDGTFTNADFSETAGISLSKLQSGVGGALILADADGIPNYQSVSGAASLTPSGVWSLTTGAVNSDAIANGSITGTDILTGTISSLHVADASLTTSDILDSTLTNADLAGAAGIALSKLASGSAGQLLLADGSGVPAYTTLSGVGSLASDGTLTLGSGVVGSSAIADGTITADDILSGAIGNAAIAPTAGITLSKLASGSASRLVLTDTGGVPGYVPVAGDATLASDGTLTLGSGSVTTLKILDGTVSGADVLDGGLSSTDILDNTLTNADLAASAGILLNKLVSGSGGQLIIAGSGGAPEYANLGGDAALGSDGILTLGSGVVTSAKIFDGTITSSDILDSTLTNADFAAAAGIALTKLANGTSGQAIIANVGGVPTYQTLGGDATLASDGTITLGSGVVSSLKILDGSITGTDILDSTLTNADLAASAGIVLSKLAGGSAGQFILADSGGIPGYVTLGGDAALTSDGTLTLGTGVVTSSKIFDGTITSGDILDSTLTNSDISASASIAGTKISPDFGSQNIITSGSVTIGSSGSALKKYISTTVTLSTNLISGILCGNLGSATVTGAEVGDTVYATPLATGSGIETTNLSWSAYVSAANTVAIRSCNPTLVGLNILDSQDWRIDILKH